MIDILTIYRLLTCQSSLDRHPYRVFYDKVDFWLFNGLVIFSRPNPVGEKHEFQFETSEIFIYILIQIYPNKQNYLITFQFVDPPYCMRLGKCWFSIRIPGCLSNENKYLNYLDKGYSNIYASTYVWIGQVLHALPYVSFFCTAVFIWEV